LAWIKTERQGEESSKILWDLPQYTRGFGYDIGCGPAKAYSHMIGIDNRKDTSMFGIPMEPDLTVPDAANLSILASGQADFVYSSHLLEHIQDYKAALTEWWRLLKVGGYMTLYLPHADFYPNIGKDGANPDHKHDFRPKDIIRAMKEIGTWDLVECQERNGTGCDGRVPLG
jgi:predicted SAM-dependent methyltransferase